MADRVWKEWKGNKNFPRGITGDMEVIVRMRDGNETHEPQLAGEFHWKHEDAETVENNRRRKFDIIAYSVVE